MTITNRITMLVAAATASLVFAGSSGAQDAKAADEAKMKAEAKITEAAARATAQKVVPNGTVKASELEREHGKLIYTFELKIAGKSGVEEVNVDAVTGAVVAHEHESEAMVKKEAAEEAKEKRAKKG
jgi:uncharacterized membrane protein YkoI